MVTPPDDDASRSPAIGEIPVRRALKDVGIIPLPMAGVLALVILLPDLILYLPPRP